MFKDWIKDLWNLSIENSDDVNIDIAKANYQKYQDYLKRQQDEYIKDVCRKIKLESRQGDKYTDTLCVKDKDFMTPEFLLEMKTYFEQRGFNTDIKSYCYGSCENWLRIRWE